MEQKSNKENDVIKESFISKISVLLHKLSNKISPIRQILIWYFVISIFGALLLYFPISHNSGQSITFIDALFVSSSAFSDTGLTTVSLAEKFNWFGKVIVFILLNIGGVGWFTIKIFIITFILRKRTQHSDITSGAAEVGTVKKRETLGLVFSAITISFFSTIIFGFIFGILFAVQTPIDVLGTVPDGSLTPNLKGHWGGAMMTGFFHAAASINNSGLDIFQGKWSLGPYSGNYVIQIMTMFLFILGGIGFGVFYDIYVFFKFKSSGKTFTFSLITKLSVAAYAIIALIGLTLVYSSEAIMLVNGSEAPFLSNKNKDITGSTGAKMWALTFNTFSTRNAGFSTMDINNLGWSTKFIYSLMMFIGSGPGSTAGGLRTTTIAVLFLGLWSHLRRKPTTTAFKRKIPLKTLESASVIFFSALVLTFISVLLISIAEPQKTTGSLINIICVVYSAFGTTGLSPIANDNLARWGIFSKLVVILLMFIGQMGMATTISQFKSKNVHAAKNYIEEKVNLG